MKTLVINSTIFRHMTNELPFWEKSRLELHNQGKGELIGAAAWLMVLGMVLLWFIPLQDKVPLAIMSGTFGPVLLWGAIRITLDEGRRAKKFQDIRRRVRIMEEALKLGDTSQQRDSEVIGAIRRWLVEFAKPIVVFQGLVKGLGDLIGGLDKNDPTLGFHALRLEEFQKDTDPEKAKALMGRALDYSKECFGDRIDSGWGLGQFFRQAEAELKR
jgi:hypothetical protein